MWIFSGAYKIHNWQFSMGNQQSGVELIQKEIEQYFLCMYDEYQDGIEVAMECLAKNDHPINYPAPMVVQDISLPRQSEFYCNRTYEYNDDSDVWGEVNDIHENDIVSQCYYKNPDCIVCSW